MTSNSEFRIFEWVATIAIFGLGIDLLFFPDALSFSRFSTIGYATSPAHLALICLASGIVRALGLKTAGRLIPWCLRMRATGSILSFCVWVQLASSLLMNDLHTPSLSVPVYLALSYGELATVWRVRRRLNAVMG